jgi:hypothetical protein
MDNSLKEKTALEFVDEEIRTLEELKEEYIKEGNWEKVILYKSQIQTAKKIRLFIAILEGKVTPP